MNESLRSLVGELLETSSFLASLDALKGAKGKSRLFGERVRALTGDEKERLRAGGNRCADWGRILVTEAFTPECIAGSTFVGDCVVGALKGEGVNVEEAVSLPSGIFNSTIVNCEIGDGCLVSNVSVVSNYILRGDCVVFDAGAVTASDHCVFGNGREIAIGIETGGREVLSYAEITIPVATAVATRRSDRKFLEAYAAFVQSYVDSCRAPFGVVDRGGVIRHAARVEDVYLGGGAVIDGATVVKNVTILSTPEERTGISHGAYVRNSCIQYGCEVTSMAIVDDSVLTEHSHVERHGKVTQSIIGPNTGVAEGEVTASLVGPFVGFHHQAMLIAALWPEGKGNVGYGANVGSNHTSKAPDQEIWCGEGFFFGLGINVKFPSDFTEAPYGLIATAVDTLPQRIEFPFALINKPFRALEGIPPAYNEIFPAWVLSDNLYTVLRNEGKYKKRNKARRTEFVFDVFRRDIVEKMVTARDRLESVEEIKEHYTDKDIPGLGKNFMMEESRARGIDTYNLFIEYFVLQGLAARVAELLGDGETGRVASVYEDETGDSDWEYRRTLLNSEGYNGRSVSGNLERLGDIQERIARDTQMSKERDDIRGKKIITDYAEANTQAPDDGFVKETWEKARTVRAELQDLATRLDGS
jgi:carbonic anhydrase/acetyltransferase-like protein (isoleucine patch superfamily)